MDPTIAQIQERKELEILKKYKHVDQPQDAKENGLEREQSAAARVLQRTYRGHRARRELRGLSLDPSTRWVEVRASPFDNLPCIPVNRAIKLIFIPSGSQGSSIPQPHQPQLTLLHTAVR
jgi:hypothetical protein